jgi:plastocyanin
MRLAAMVGCLVASAAAHAGTVTGTITVNRAVGQEPAPVLVYVVGFEEPAPDVTPEVLQKGKKFIPDLIAITADQSISFPNGDPLLHNVFSPTERRRFDLGSYPEGDTRIRTFPSPGVSDVYCNIHPEMSATIVVLPNRRFGFAGADGSVRIDDVPAGAWTVFAYSRRAARPVSAKVEVTATGTATVALTLDETRTDFTHRNKFGEKYRGEGEYRPSR